MNQTGGKIMAQASNLKRDVLVLHLEKELEELTQAG